jgi:hypothetical protein
MYKERKKANLSIHVCLFASVVKVVGWKLDLSFDVLLNRGSIEKPYKLQVLLIFL